MMDDERSAEARAVAELALVRLLAAGAPTSESMIVLGGLVPSTLTSDLPSAPAHLGTTDVDVLLVTHLTADRDLSPIEDALRAMDLAPEGDGWRWRGRVEGRVVKIEFLCDLDDQPAEAIVTRPTRRDERADEASRRTAPHLQVRRLPEGAIDGRASRVSARGMDWGGVVPHHLRFRRRSSLSQAHPR